MSVQPVFPQILKKGYCPFCKREISTFGDFLNGMQTSQCRFCGKYAGYLLLKETCSICRRQFLSNPIKNNVQQDVCHKCARLNNKESSEVAGCLPAFLVLFFLCVSIIVVVVT